MLVVCIDVFIGQICAAGESYLAVNGSDLPVIPVVLQHGKHRRKRAEHLALDSHGFKIFGIFFREREKTAHVVKHQAHIESCFCLLAEHFQNGVPHDAFFNDKEFKENIAFRLLQACKKCVVKAFTGGIINGSGVLIDRKPGKRLQITLLRGAGRIGVRRC